ncbi:MAG: Asp-tRNA(Asn)/Glu-tRNA(Gln) amidotransferase subunit GatB [Alphaproteobacteria bacterium]|jgi:aspartyl-tRNA(Asn)/glutamyl-tRNA(Gln) amidotransferase subunit B|nr:Asp-tRNA(Asn)/Glu-tRNA(Gln) amidotransferase subunit GatB [Alphaproteobacteria bacterium]
MTSSFSATHTQVAGPWEVVIGLEVHAQVLSEAKLFSGAATTFGAMPNTQVCFVDAALPGTLPVINRFCVEQAIKTGLGLNAEIHLFSVFDRKNYFYADLPQGYQISQYKHPIVGEGYLDIEDAEGHTKRIGIERLHLEQDAGKSMHDQRPDKSHIDLNRAGVALMEIVSKPDMRSAEEAQAYVKKLRALLRCLGTCDGNMEQGSMRADVNISLRKPGEPYGTRAEIKNVNSVRFIGQAILYEIARQREILEGGGTVDQETRLFDAARGLTRSMRSKEDAHDYRYFPDPNLPPLVVEAALVKRLKASLPELPDAKKNRFMADYGIASYDAAVLTSETEISDYFEAALVALDTKDAAPSKMLANWMMTELFAALNKDGLTITESKVTPAHFAELITLIQKGVISGKIAKDVFVFMWDSGKAPQDIVKEKGLEQVSDTGAIEGVIDAILATNPDKVTEYRSGKDKLFGFFVGQVMKQMGGKANPALVNEALLKKLSS